MLTSGIDVPIENCYEDPTTTGVDRLLNALAAFALCGERAIVIDFGTATKIDCISPDGAFLGGAIAPGLQLSLEALAQKAAKLGEVELVCPPQSIGRNTTHSLQSGLVLGHAAMVDGLVRRMSREMGEPKVVFATGGLAPVVAQLCETITTASPCLTLQGALAASRLSR
jgi:type III pantothenate kinase